MPEKEQENLQVWEDIHSTHDQRVMVMVVVVITKWRSVAALAQTSAHTHTQVKGWAMTEKESELAGKLKTIKVHITATGGRKRAPEKRGAEKVSPTVDRRADTMEFFTYRQLSSHCLFAAVSLHSGE